MHMLFLNILYIQAILAFFVIWRSHFPFRAVLALRFGKRFGTVLFIVHFFEEWDGKEFKIVWKCYVQSKRRATQRNNLFFRLCFAYILCAWKSHWRYIHGKEGKKNETKRKDMRKQTFPSVSGISQIFKAKENEPPHTLLLTPKYHTIYIYSSFLLLPIKFKYVLCVSCVAAFCGVFSDSFWAFRL